MKPQERRIQFEVCCAKQQYCTFIREEILLLTCEVGRKNPQNQRIPLSPSTTRHLQPELEFSSLMRFVPNTNGDVGKVGMLSSSPTSLLSPPCPRPPPLLCPLSLLLSAPLYHSFKTLVALEALANVSLSLFGPASCPPPRSLLGAG